MNPHRYLFSLAEVPVVYLWQPGFGARLPPADTDLTQGTDASKKGEIHA